MKFQIRSRWTNEVKLEVELNASFEAQPYGMQLGAAIKIALKRGSDLRGSNLSGSDLSDCNLSRSNLRDCNLSRSDLSRSILRDCNLRDCDLSGSDLSGSILRGSDLSRSDLRAVKADFFDVLLRASHEVAALETALLEGRVDGSQYEGECACLVGTIANAKHCNYEAVPNLKPNSSRASERWFLAIRPGDTPDKSQIAAITLEWIREFTELLAEATR